MAAHALPTLVNELNPPPWRPLRVAVVTETYPPEVNGVANTLARTVQGLRQRHHRVQLVRPRQAHEPATGQLTEQHPRLRELLVRGLPVPRYPELRMGLPAPKALQRLWTQHRPDVVHVATEGPLGWSALRVATQLGLPVSSDFRTNFHAYSQHYGIGALRRPIMAYLRHFHNRCALTTVPTEPLRQELAAQGFDKLHTLARGVDVAQFNPAHRSDALRAEWGVAPDQLVVACVGRLAAEKNLGLVLEAYQAIARHQPQAKLLLVGDGPWRDELQRRCPQALLAGQRRGSDLAAHYASADLFLFASQTETFGNVTSEAMASGLPVVAFKHAAAGQMITHGHSGWLAPLQDPAAFVHLALAAAADAPARQRMGQAARQRACQQGWDEVMVGFERLLLQAIHAQDPGRIHLPRRAPSVA